MRYLKGLLARARKLLKTFLSMARSGPTTYRVKSALFAVACRRWKSSTSDSPAICALASLTLFAEALRFQSAPLLFSGTALFCVNWQYQPISTSWRFVPCVEVGWWCVSRLWYSASLTPCTAASESSRPALKGAIFQRQNSGSLTVWSMSSPLNTKKRGRAFIRLSWTTSARRCSRSLQTLQRLARL